MTLQDFLSEKHVTPGDRDFPAVRHWTGNPTAIVSTEEYLNIMLYVLKDMSPEDLPDDFQNSFFAVHLVEMAAGSSREEFHDLEQYMLRQDEMMFIDRNANTSAAEISYGLPAHWHRNTYFDIAYVFQGTARFYFRNETVNLNPGQILIVPPEIEHGECSLSADTRAMTVAIRRSAFLSTYLDIFSDNPFLHSLFQRILSGNKNENEREPEGIAYLLFRAPDPETEGALLTPHESLPSSLYHPEKQTTKNAITVKDPELMSLFFQTLSEQSSDLPYHNKTADALTYMILVHLLRYYEHSLCLPADADMRWKPEYDPIFRCISESYTDITLDDLSQRFHYSKRQLMRIIQECTGQNFKDLIQSMRLRLAADLLEETTLPVEEVAARCGYKNFSSFSRMFREARGCTPSQYREGKR